MVILLCGREAWEKKKYIYSEIKKNLLDTSDVTSTIKKIAWPFPEGNARKNMGGGFSCDLLYNKV